VRKTFSQAVSAAPSGRGNILRKGKPLGSESSKGLRYGICYAALLHVNRMNIYTKAGSAAIE
jgi:hypothetical protein